VTAGATSGDELTVSVVLTVGAMSLTAEADEFVVLNWTAGVALPTGRPTQAGAALTLKVTPAEGDALVIEMLAGVTKSPVVVSVPAVPPIVVAVPATVTTMAAEVAVSAVAGFTVTVAPVSPGPALAEQLIVPAIVGDEFSRFARMVPTPRVRAISAVVTSALTPWILNFDTSIVDRPSLEGFSTTSPGDDRSFDR
jgi:hypothetical protein